MTVHAEQLDAAFTLERLHHVQLAIPPGGEDVGRRFYGELLGLTEVEKPPVLAARGGCWFRNGFLEIHLGVELDFRPGEKAHPAILVDHIEALARRLEASGVGINWDDNYPGYRRFYARDPHGNRLEFTEPRHEG